MRSADVKARSAILEAAPPNARPDILKSKSTDGYARLVTNLLIDNLPLMVSTRISSEDYLTA